jgi:N-acetylmuramic acid 6-phosphate etherase
MLKVDAPEARRLLDESDGSINRALDKKGVSV